MNSVAQPARHQELGKFLASRRTRLKPESCGLPSRRARRRTPGLRREDVSSIAGISTAYYTWIEQGRPFDISVDVLHAIASALRLSDTESGYIFALAGKAQLRGKCPDAPLLSTDSIMQVVTSFEGGPALVLTPWLDVIGGNDQARDFFSFEPGTNFAHWFFCEHDPRVKISSCGGVADTLVALLRQNRARAGDTSPFTSTVEGLRAESDAFAILWDGYVVDATPLANVEFERHGFGRVAYRTTLLCDPVAARRFALFMTPI